MASLLTAATAAIAAGAVVLLWPSKIGAEGPPLATTLEMGNTREKGDRMKEGTAGEAEQQFEEIDRAQRKSREGKDDTIIDSTEKSRERADEN